MAGKKIMIVDDDKAFLEELQEALSLFGYETIPISNSSIASFAAYTTKPNIILLDMKMDGMDGFQVAQTLKRFSSTAHIPIIAMTSFFKKENHFTLMDLCGIKKCFEKPFNPSEILDQIEEVLRES